MWTETNQLRPIGTFSRWAPGEPNARSTMHCMILYKPARYHWHDATCTDKHTFVCEMEWWQVSSRWISFRSPPLSWYFVGSTLQRLYTLDAEWHLACCFVAAAAAAAAATTQSLLVKRLDWNLNHYSVTSARVWRRRLNSYSDAIIGKFEIRKVL